MGQRQADGAGIAVDVAVEDLAERGVHGRLGDAVQIDQARQSGMAVQPRLQTLGFERLATEHHRLQLQLLPRSEASPSAICSA